MRRFRHARRRLLCVAAAAGLMAGCAAPRQMQSAPQADYWSGRISVLVQASSPQSTSGSFELSGSAAQGELLLLNPLGNIVARVRWGQQQAEITQGAQTRQAASLDALTDQLLGAALPIDALFDWLHGRATQAQGWKADLSARAQGKISARRTSPQPEAGLRILLDTP